MAHHRQSLNLQQQQQQLLLLLAFVFVLGFLTSSCHALYEDQVGVWDWHQQYIGRVKHAVFQTQGSGRKRVVVATEQNALASLNLRTGEIYWRHVLGESDPIDVLELASGKYVMTLSGGTNVRAWHLPDGVLIWEAAIPSSKGSNPPRLVALPVDIDYDKINDLLVLSGSVLTALSGQDGTTIWKVDISGKDVDIRDVIVATEELKAYGVGFIGDSGFTVIEIDLQAGTITDRKTAMTSETLSVTELLVSKQFAVALDSKGTHLVTVSINANGLTVLETALSSLSLNAVGLPKLLPTKLDGAISLALGDLTAIVAVDPTSGELRTVETLVGAVAVSDSLSVANSKHSVAIIQLLEGGHSQNTFSLHVHGEDWTEVVQKETVKLPSHRGHVQKVFLNAYLRTDRTHGFRALVVGEDDSLLLLQQGEIVWTREDELASIVDAKSAELPLERDGVSVAEVEHDLAEWLKGHFLKLKATLFLASADEIAAVQESRLNQADKTKLTRDHNGFRKLLLVLTKSGKLLALHTGDGRIVWSLLIPGFRAPHGGPQVCPEKLLLWQVPHQHAEERPEVLVLGKSCSTSDFPAVLSWVDAYKGIELHTMKLSYPVTHAFGLPLTDSSEQRLHLFVDDQAQAHLLPGSEESLDLFLKQKDNAYFYEVDRTKGIIEGYGIKGLVESSRQTSSEGYLFETEKLWSVVFPEETESIATVATRRPDEVVHTQAKVLGNREVLFKYLNKNMIFVATVTPKSVGLLGAASPEDSTVVAYLIDTVTGRILHRVTHPSMQGPVHAVLSENWVVYHYFNLRNHRYEMSVLETYDQSRVGDKGVMQLMLGRHNASAPLSSYSSSNVEVKGQSYFFTYTVKTLTVTTTARGITSKQLLLGTVTDQVLALDKRLLDPRRSATPTPSEREEGILPLTDAIPISPQGYLTNGYQVEGLRGILTIPARLESTCLVFAYGLDLFYTRTAPSRTYDSLTEDFSYALLLMTIVALLIAIAVTYVLAERKELAEKWK
ncbi:unnamed protein product [Sphagnum jensenii]|uniref:ER membrane protein complex subunit 1 n=1 Tax=Sphagnum jensenii TaxID=128206 RepID=A0ABP0WVC4_9BRYO